VGREARRRSWQLLPGSAGARRAHAAAIPASPSPVNGQSRTFKDGEGVTFPRNQGAKQTVSGEAAFAGYGVTFAPLGQDDYAQRNVSGRVAVFLGRTGPKGFTTTHNRILNARGRVAVDGQPCRRDDHAGVAQLPGAGGQRSPVAARGLSNRAAPRRADPAADHRERRLLHLPLQCLGHRLRDTPHRREKQEPLPNVALSGISITINVDAAYDVIQTRLTRNVVGLIRG
jgi:hypothetical protein